MRAQVIVNSGASLNFRRITKADLEGTVVMSALLSEADIQRCDGDVR
jgi:uncharacterized protein YjbI with pentapeptide repeats